MNRRLQHLVAELRSRSVFRALVAYGVASWMLLQIADVTFDRLPLPENSMTVLIIMVIIGFPVTFVLAWGYEFTRQGIVRHEETDGGAPRMEITSYIVLVVAVTVTAGSLLYYVAEKTWQPGPRSVAVLPFDNITQDEDTEYFSDGLTEEIQNLIIRLNEFRVVAMGAGGSLQDSFSDVISIARRLDADVVLQGSVRRYPDRVSVTARLFDGHSGLSIWGQKYDRELADVANIQQDIARQVARALHVVLPVSAERRLENLGTRNIEAYDLYLRGIDYLRQPPDQVTLALAETNIRQAIVLDPDFANAHAAMCRLHLARYRKQRDAALFTIAESVCEEALARDDESAALYLALGGLYLESGRPDDALEQFNAALDYNDNSADAYIGIAKAQIEMQRFDEAEANLRRAIELDVSYWASFNAMGSFLFDRSRFLEAAEFFKMYVSRANDDSQAYNNLGAAFYMAGDFSQAANAWEESLAIKATRNAYSNTGTMYYYLGEFEKAADRYAEAVNLAPNDYRMWGNLADAYYQVDSMRPAAATAYRRAADLAEDQLRVNAGDVDVLSSLALYYARMDDAARADEFNERALAAGPDDMYVHYNSALINAQFGRVDETIAAVERSIDLGFAVQMLAGEPALSSLHSDDRFRRMMSANGI